MGYRVLLGFPRSGWFVSSFIGSNHVFFFAKYLSPFWDSGGFHLRNSTHATTPSMCSGASTFFFSSNKGNALNLEGGGGIDKSTMMKTKRNGRRRRR